jgi:hypothetical protein
MAGAQPAATLCNAMQHAPKSLAPGPRGRYSMQRNATPQAFRRRPPTKTKSPAGRTKPGFEHLEFQRT